MKTSELPFTFTLGNGKEVTITQEHFDAAQDLIGVWFQISRKYRMVARLPAEKTGIEALIEAARRTGYPPRKDLEDWARGLGEGSAGDHYLCCYAPQKEEDWKELDIPTFQAFRRLGGTTYQSWHYEKTHPDTFAKIKEVKKNIRAVIKES
jgi:hypothetical protein